MEKRRLVSRTWFLFGIISLLLLGGTAGAQVWGPVRVEMMPIGGNVELPMVAENLHIDIDGQHAAVRMQQTFHNATGMNVEGRYTLLAGPGARATGFAYWNGEQKIVGEVFEKETARQVYRRVVDRRRDPGLLVEKSDGEFSFMVAPIAPDEKKRVEVAYSRWLSRRNGIIDLLTPVSLADAEITVTINDKRQLKGFASSTHEIEVKQLGSGKILVRASKKHADAKAFALRYEVVEAPWTVNAYVHRNKGEDAYVAVTLAAPAGAEKISQPKDVTLVIDRSGSMAGEKLKQARAACLGILKRLTDKDRVNVMLFDDEVESLFHLPKPVTAQTRNEAMEYVELMESGGGTSIAKALTDALDDQIDGPQPRVVLFFTDGRSPSAPALVAAEKDKHDVRVFTIGIGREIDKALLSRLAALKRGRFTYIPESANMEQEVAALFSQIEVPVLIDVALETQNGRVSNSYPRVVPDLFNNDELLITGRLRGKDKVEISLAGIQDGKRVIYRTQVTMVDQVLRPWVGRLWAKSRIDFLLDEIALNGPNPELIDEVTELALAYNFVTPYTSFLAIPASEVDEVSANQLANARARKQEIMKRKSGSASLAAAEPGPASVNKSAPADGDPLMKVSVQRSSGGEDSLKEITKAYEAESGKKGGCASCNLGGQPVGGDGAAATSLLALLGLLAMRRKNRRK
jgi:Ca-activated chloride channel family protein